MYCKENSILIQIMHYNCYVKNISMSYSDDEELKIGDLSEEDDLDSDFTDPLLDDDLLPDEEEDLEGFAGIDGAEY